MGYRSNVALIIKTDVYNSIKNSIGDSDELKYSLFKEACITQNEIYTILHWDDIKYYSNFEDVQFIENIRNNNDSYFVRIGEEYSDIEESWNGGDYDMLDYLGIDRSIYIGI